MVRNFKPLWSRFGTVIGSALALFDLWFVTLTRGFSLFGTLKHHKTDAESTGLAKDFKPIVYPKPDGEISFDKLSSVFMSSTNHEEDQPPHLKLTDPSVPIGVNLPKFGEPARLYCPAGVYEVLYDEAGANPRFQINAQNCVRSSQKPATSRTRRRTSSGRRPRRRRAELSEHGAGRSFRTAASVSG